MVLGLNRDPRIKYKILYQQIIIFNHDIETEMMKVNFIRRLYLLHSKYYSYLQKILLSELSICMEKFQRSNRSPKAFIRAEKRLANFITELRPKVYNKIHGLTELP